MTITKEQFFKSGRATAQEKTLATDNAARQIIESEARLRVQKTERLRELRAQQEAKATPQPVARRGRAVKSSQA